MKKSFLNLYHIKKSTKLQHLKFKVIEINRNSYHRKIFQTHLFPKKNVTPPYLFKQQTQSVPYELEWLSAIIELNKNKIAEFLSLKEEYTFYYFNSDFKKCAQILELIEDRFGISTWLIENKINLLKSIDSSYKLSEEYFDELLKSQVILHYKIIAWIILMKSEDLMSPTRFEIELDKRTGNWKALTEYGLDDYLKFKFLTTIDKEEIDYLTILRVQENLNIIDRYQNLTEILNGNVEGNYLNISKDKFEGYVTQLYNINKASLSTYYKIQGNYLFKEKSLHLSKLSEAFDYYSAGNYIATITMCEKILREKPQEIEIYEIYAKSLLTQNIHRIDDSTENLSIKIINLILSYYKNPEYIDDDLVTTDLLKICTNHISNEWAWKLLSLSYVIKFGNTILEKIPSFKKGYKLSNFIKPQILPFIFSNKKSVENYINFVFDEKSITKKVHEAYLNSDISLLNHLAIDVNRKLRLQGKLHLLNENYDEALSCFNSIDEKNTQIYEFEINIGKIQAYTALENVELAIDIIVDSYFSNKNLLLESDVPKIYDALDTELLDNSNINILLFVDLVSKYVDPTLFNNKHDFLEDFLIANDLNLISDIDISTVSYDKTKLIYVLDEYCTIDNMAQYYYFASQEQVEEERIKICRILSELDPEKVAIYKEEIREIAQRMQIRESSAALEKSKIYVDIDGIKKQATKKIEDDFSRLAEYFTSVRERQETLVFTLEGKIDDFKGDRYSDLYNDLVFQIRDTFISSREYGLDVYLSLGIRHGTIFGQLRKIFEKDNFLTLFVSNQNKYKENYFWFEKMNISDSLIREKVDNIFQNFNIKIDALLIDLKDQTLQITKENKNKTALFNYHIPSFNLLLLFIKDAKKKEMDIDDFISSVIDQLWKITEENLSKVREYLTLEFREMLLEEIDLFVNAISELKLNEQNNALLTQEFDQKIIDLRTDLEYQINKVSNWFTKEKIVDIDNFSLDLPINIALDYTRSININSTLIPNLNIETNLQVDGKYLKWFSELFIAILDNIIKRSGYRDTFIFSINIYINDRNQLVINSSNHLKLSEEEIEHRKIELQSKMEEIKIALKTEESEIISRASSEGGSGLYKIVKLLKYDIKAKETNLDFGIDENEYCIKIASSTGGFAVVDTDS